MQLPADIYQAGNELVVIVDLPANGKVEFVVAEELVCLLARPAGESKREGGASSQAARVTSYVPLPTRVVPDCVRAHLADTFLELRLVIEKPAQPFDDWNFSARRSVVGSADLQGRPSGLAREAIE